MQTNDERDESAGLDQRDFVQVFTEHSRRIYRYILTLTVNHADAEEVFQTTSLVLWRKFSQYDPSFGSFYTWACRVAFLEVLHLRRDRRRDVELSDEAIQLLASEAEKCSDNLESREWALKQCLEELPPKDLQLIQLRYASSRPPIEIAQILDRPKYVIYRSLSRIHGTLRRCVSRKLAHDLL